MEITATMEEKNEKFNVVEQFGVDVFNEETMKQRLPKNVFKALKKTIAIMTSSY